MAYLDENGLEHFWGKIKDRVSSAVAPKADDADVVHKTGDEIVQGEKVFKNEKVYSTTGNHISNISIRNPAVRRGTATSFDNNKSAYSVLHFLDGEGSEERPYDGRLAMLEYGAPSTGSPQEHFSFVCYDYFSEDGRDDTRLSLGYDLDRIPYATAPATSDDRTDSTDIVTRGYMEASEWNWQKTKKAGTVAFKPVPESDLEPVVDFMFTETLPAEGEKGPENPSTISGVTQVKVTRCGKNLLCVSFNSGTKNGLTYTRNADGSVTISGTATQDTYYNFGGAPNISESLYLEGTYTLSGAPNNLGSNYRLVCFKNGLPSSEDTGTGISFSLPSKTHIWFSFFVKEGFPGSGNTVTFHPQLELGTVATPFEPYSGSDYTIQLGDTYYGGSLDATTGVMTVTWEGFALTGEESGWEAAGEVGTSGIYRYSCIDLFSSIVVSDNAQICSHFDYVYNWNLGIEHFYAGNKTPNFFSSISTLASFKSWVAAQYANSSPVTVVASLATPYTVQLTPTQIRSLPALDKYEPRINTVYSDQEAVQVGYQRFYDENRLAAIEARLDALEGN